MTNPQTLKIIGSLEEIRGHASVRIKVLSFRRGTETLTSDNDIKKQFPPQGFVFYYNFFEAYDYKLHSLVECFAAPNTQKSPGYDEYSVDSHRECKPFGFRLFELPATIFINELSINQPVLKRFVEEEGSAFYCKVDDHIYGPFKNERTEIVPKTGKEVNQYVFDAALTVVLGENRYLLHLPQSAVAKVDCMTPAQLADWLRPHLEKKLAAADFAAIRKVIEVQQGDGLDKPRLQRALLSIDQLSLYYDDIKAISAFGGAYAEHYANALKAIKEELTQELIDPYVEQKDQLEKDIKKLKTLIEKTQTQESNTRQKLEALTAEYSNLTEQKERLISDLKIHALVHTAPGAQTISTFEEQDFTAGSGEYKDLQEFANLFNQSISLSDTKTEKPGHKIIYQFKEKKCLLAPCAGTVLQLAKLSGNCRVFIQQAEPDWLKFEYFFNNGLKQVWESAYQNSERIHFFILEDINLASIECYGKPLLDLLAGVRQTIPVLKLKWPNNLWLFGIPAVEAEGQRLGLPMIQQSFVHWGAIPKDVVVFPGDEQTPAKKLAVEQLMAHDKIIPDSVNEYF